MHLLPTNYQKSQFCHSILTVWIARQSTSWNYLKSTWITWRPSILNFRCRNSISIWLCFLWATEMSRTVKQPIRAELNIEPHFETANQSRAQHWAALWNSQSEQSSTLLFTTLPNKPIADSLILGRNPRVVNGHVKLFLETFALT